MTDHTHAGTDCYDENCSMNTCPGNHSMCKDNSPENELNTIRVMKERIRKLETERNKYMTESLERLIRIKNLEELLRLWQADYDAYPATPGLQERTIAALEK